MKNVRIVLALMASVFFLSHCGTEDPVPPGAEAMDLRGNECIAGVYRGEGDVRWNTWPVDQDLVVSIALQETSQGTSALVKVVGEGGDLLCTQYEGLKVTPVEDEEGVSVLSAARVTNSRVAEGSDNLADSLLDIQVNLGDADAPCSFNIGSLDADSRIGDGRDDDSIESSQLERQAGQADFNALLDECGGVDKFVELPQEEEEEEAEDEETAEAEEETTA